MLKINNSPQQSREINRKINKIFEETNINPTPMNYLVWYHFFLGENQALVEAIKQLSKGAKSFNDYMGVRLYERFIEAPHTEKSDDYDFAVKKFIDDMLFKAKNLNTGMTDQSQLISDLTKDLTETKLAKKELESIAQSIVEAATIMQQNTEAFNAEVQSGSEEVKQLKKQLDEARKDALTDDLTQIGNRKAFNNLIQDLTLHHRHSPEPLCLILSDIDHFKSFNDTYGHPVGDSVLRYYAKILQHGATEKERVCRYGGEEFAILLRNTSLDEATQRAEQIRQNIESARLTLKDSSEPIKPITASFGISFFHGEEDDIETFINRADQSLYEAKEAGRNTVRDEMFNNL